MEPNSEAFEGPTASIWIDFHLIEWAHQVSNSGSWEPLVLEPPWIRAWITVKNRSLLITGIISPVGVLVPFMKDTTTLCLMIVMAIIRNLICL
jgi:hypothetical protein